MKNFLIAIIITNFSLCISTTLFAQKGQVSYSYDNAGNRIAREVIYLAPAGEMAGADSIANTPAGHASILQSLETEAQVKSNTLKVFPNPTHGKLDIQFTGDMAGLKAEILVYNNAGVMVYQNTNTTHNT